MPVFTVGIGEDRKVVAVRITDLQAPDLTPPDEPFKINVEVDGEGLAGKTVPVTITLAPPAKEGSASGLPSIVRVVNVNFAPGEPPHGAAEIIVNPDDKELDPRRARRPSRGRGRRRRPG